MINVQIPLPDELARDAQAAGLLTPRALANLIRDGIKRKAAQQIIAGAAKASEAGSKPMNMEDIQREVDAVRKSKRATTSNAAA
jgi:hypothetical protein